MKRKVKKIKNVLPLLNLQYMSKIVVKQKQDDVYVPLGGGTSTSIISRFGEMRIDKCNIVGSVLNIYVK